MTPCYVSGKGMHASATTWNFKVAVIEALEHSGLGYDTRYRYYQSQYPGLSQTELARRICDPIEYYDKDWPAARDGRPAEQDEETALMGFWLERDGRFRQQAAVGIFGYDEAGFGSGVNSLRFLHAGKPILGFYNPQAIAPAMNIHNVKQLGVEYPGLFTLKVYRRPEDVAAMTLAWLRDLDR